jgi:polysaccharide export outer membrane protein
VVEAFPPVDPSKGYTLGPGDVVKITVFQQPEMTIETRVSEVGTLTVPLLGPVDVNNLSTKQAEMRIANQLKARGYVREPFANITILQFKSRQISILGYVSKPGRYALEEGSYRVSDALSLAGGVIPGAGDVAFLLRMKGGNAQKFEIDIPGVFRAGNFDQNIEVKPGDTIYVDRTPYFYIYGEVQHPGQYRLEKDMTVVQALSVGGGLTVRGSKKDIQINRRDKLTGKAVNIGVQLTDLLQPDDVVFVKESLF